MSELRDMLTTKLLWPINQLTKGITPGMLREFVSRDRLSALQVHGLQCQRLREFLRYCRKHSPFYAERFASCGADPEASDIMAELAKVPVLDKDAIRLNLERIMPTQFHDHAGLIKKATGGSTGRPLIIYGDKADYRQNGLAIARQRLWVGWRGGERMVTLFGGYRDVPSRMRRTMKRLLVNETLINVMDSEVADYGQILARVRAIRPKVILGYLSALGELARAAQAAGQPLEGVRLAVAAAEPLDERVRAHIEQWLGAPVYAQYGTRELGTFAQECTAKQGYHYAQDSTVVEVLDDQAQPSDKGHLTITYMGNLVTPLVRYQPGDVASMADEPCACGLPWARIAAIEGRASRDIVLASGRRITSNLIVHIIKDYPWVWQYQAHQPSLDELVIRIRRIDSEFSEPSLRHLDETLRGLLGPQIKLSWRFDEPFLPVPTGKHVCFISDIEGKPHA